MENFHNNTVTFSLKNSGEEEMRKIITAVYNALVEKGYEKPINQIVGYLLSEDPIYITKHNNARNLIRKIDRDELLSAMVKKYLES